MRFTLQQQIVFYLAFSHIKQYVALYRSKDVGCSFFAGVGIVAPTR